MLQCYKVSVGNSHVSAHSWPSYAESSREMYTQILLMSWYLPEILYFLQKYFQNNRQETDLLFKFFLTIRLLFGKNFTCELLICGGIAFISFNSTQTASYNTLLDYMSIFHGVKLCFGKLLDGHSFIVIVYKLIEMEYKSFLYSVISLLRLSSPIICCMFSVIYCSCTMRHFCFHFWSSFSVFYFFSGTKSSLEQWWNSMCNMFGICTVIAWMNVLDMLSGKLYHILFPCHVQNSEPEFNLNQLSIIWKKYVFV